MWVGDRHRAYLWARKTVCESFRVTETNSHRESGITVREQRFGVRAIKPRPGQRESGTDRQRSLESDRPSGR